jgi:diguanylate cyclase (GGDEF)-like protein
MGSATGVVHLVRGHDRPFVATEATFISGVAQQLGSRLGLISAMAQSELQANTDPLTGLLNRRSLENQVRSLIGVKRRFTVVLVDLDHFKDLNDTHGHDAGDRALRVFAQVLRSSVRDGDLACRYGGEEFVIVMPDASADDAIRAVDRLRMELHGAFSDGRTPPFTFSAGVADSSTSLDLAELITIADEALLEAKRSGRDRTISFSSTALTPVTSRGAVLDG